MKMAQIQVGSYVCVSDFPKCAITFDPISIERLDLHLDRLLRLFVECELKS